jgi:hypothetical protein
MLMQPRASSYFYFSLIFSRYVTCARSVPTLKCTLFSDMPVLLLIRKIYGSVGHVNKLRLQVQASVTHSHPAAEFVGVRNRSCNEHEYERISKRRSRLRRSCRSRFTSSATIFDLRSLPLSAKGKREA